MQALEFVIYTMILLMGCIAIGLALSLAPLYMPGLNKYRIQDKKIKPQLFYQRLRLIGLNTFFLATLSSIGLYYLFPLFDASLHFSITSIILQVLVILFVDDIYFYFIHKWMHDNKYLLKNIHSIHHRTTAPLAMDYMYVHPIEWLMGYLGPFIGILIISFFVPVCIWAFWVYQLIRTLHEIDVHSGYRSILSNWIPFWGETEHHDMHHQMPNGNYASTFTLWDHIFKTKMNKK